MDHELISSLLRGCKMAKDLESNLQNMSNQQVAESCEEIIRVFSEARVRLSVGSRGQDVFRPLQMHSSLEGMNTAGIHEYVTRMLHTQLTGGSGGSSNIGAAGGSSSTGLVIELGGREHVHTLETSVMASSSSSQRQRRRKDDGEKRTEMVAAPQTGNTEIPPDDGFTWRKYGQKEILGSRYPRGYYRCTHQRLYNCPAKKQVQRMDENPSIYEVTYRGEHTCHKSATAPSVAPPPSLPETTPLHRQYQPLGEWLEFRLGGADSSAAPSSSNVNRGGDQFPVADMADVMFNSGSSSNNSMDFIFSSSMDDKWDSGDKR